MNRKKAKQIRALAFELWNTEKFPRERFSGINSLYRGMKKRYSAMSVQDKTKSFGV